MKTLLKDRTKEELQSMMPFTVYHRTVFDALESYYVSKISDKGISIWRKGWFVELSDPEDPNPFTGGRYIKKVRRFLRFGYIDDTWGISYESTEKQKAFIDNYYPNIAGMTLCKYHASELISMKVEEWNFKKNCRLAELEDPEYGERF